MEEKTQLLAQLEALIPLAKKEGLKEAVDFLRRVTRESKKRETLSADQVADAALVEAGAIPMKEATFASLRTGGWGLRIESLDVNPGEVVITSTRGGKRERKVVETIIWQGEGRTLVSFRDLTAEEKKTFKAPKAPKKEESTPSETYEEESSSNEDDLPY